MSSKFSESAIIRPFAEEICQQVTRKMVASLQKMKDGLQSGDGSGLENTWDEIYVQVQYEQSAYRDVYDSTVETQYFASLPGRLRFGRRDAIFCVSTPRT